MDNILNYPHIFCDNVRRMVIARKVNLGPQWPLAGLTPWRDSAWLNLGQLKP